MAEAIYFSLLLLMYLSGNSKQRQTMPSKEDDSDLIV